MKKLIGTAMLAALLATSAFAELSVGVWLCQLWTPVAYDGDDVKTGIQNPWGASRTGGVGLNWVGDDEKAGMSFSIISSGWGMNPTLDGNNLIWVKPWDWLKLSLGHWDNAGDTDITTVNTASWDWLRPNIWTEHLYSENEHTGALFQITPVEDLYIAVALPFDNWDKSYHMFEALAADVAYTVPDILKVMVGWRGGRNRSGRDDFATTYKSGSDFVNVGEVDVLLSLLAVENLQLDVGARINILDSDKVNDGFSKALVGLKAGYNITDRFSIKADFATKIKKTLDPEFQFGVGVGVGLTDSLSLVADFRGLLQCNDIDPIFSFLVGLNYACSSNAAVGIGFQGKTSGAVPCFEYNNYPDNDNFAFAVPIRVNVWF